MNRRGQYNKTVVKQGASIGANPTIVCGHDIGRFAFIGAGAVVTKDVPNYTLVVGNPARHTGWISEYGHSLHSTRTDLRFVRRAKRGTCLKMGNQVNGNEEVRAVPAYFLSINRELRGAATISRKACAATDTIDDFLLIAFTERSKAKIRERIIPD